MKINLNKILLDLDEKETVDNLGKILATTLAIHSSGDVIKLMDWARAFHKGEDVELDKADLIFLRGFVDKSTQITLIAKEQILNLLV